MTKEFLEVIDTLQRKIKERDEQIKYIILSLLPTLKKYENLDVPELLIVFQNLYKEVNAANFPYKLDSSFKGRNILIKNVPDMIDSLKEFDELANDNKKLYLELKKEYSNLKDKYSSKNRYIKVIYRKNLPMFSLTDILKACGITKIFDEDREKGIMIGYTYMEDFPKEDLFIGYTDAISVIEKYNKKITNYFREFDSAKIFPLAFIDSNLIIR